MDDFGRWVTRQLQERGWTRSEAARRGGISPSMMDKVIGGFANPGLDFCRGLALAFNLPVETVLRQAGILSSKEQVPGEEDLLTYYRALPERGRRLVLALAHEIWNSEEQVKRTSGAEE